MFRVQGLGFEDYRESNGEAICSGNGSWDYIVVESVWGFRNLGVPFRGPQNMDDSILGCDSRNPLLLETTKRLNCSLLSGGSHNPLPPAFSPHPSTVKIFGCGIPYFVGKTLGGVGDF